MGENAKAAPCEGSSTAKSIAVRDGRTDVDAADEEPICHVDTCGWTGCVGRRRARRRRAAQLGAHLGASRRASGRNLAPAR